MLSSVFKIVGFFLAAVAGGLVVLWLGGHPQPAPVAPGVAAYGNFGPPAGTVEVTPMATAAHYKLGGFVEARNFVKLTAQAPGRVTFIAGQEGERVASGAAVVALDDDALRVDYRSAWASLASEMAASQNAQTQLYHKLYGVRPSPMGGPAQDAYERSSPRSTT